MTCTCSHISVYTKAKLGDPTRTLTIRNAFVRQMNKRFDKIASEITKAITKNDVFGIKQEKPKVNITPGPQAFAFPMSNDKVEAFMKWMQTLIDNNILQVSQFQQVGSSVNAAWTNMYVQDAYGKGVNRARVEMIKAGYKVPTIAESGGLQSVLQGPFHMDRVGALYLRTFNELKNITQVMSNQISKVLSQGLIQGGHPYILSRKLNAVIKGGGADLGITDTLGRYIPAKRRAQMLARTEMIRAHHQATIQEYKNWGMEGVTVKAEWVTAGDDRVCEQCSGMEGNIYSLKQIEHMIPVHPNCLIDGQVKIYTSKGWKAIRDIIIGDLVLTHKHRFKKVYALPRTPKQTPKVVSFYFWKTEKLTVTENHRVKVQDDNGNILWKEAGQVLANDKLFLLANKCKRCGAEIPYFRTYCSRTCLSKDITDRQWKSEAHRKNISEKNSKSMNEQYRLGLRDKDTITKAANKKVKELAAKGEFVLQRPDIKAKIKEVTNTKEHRAASSKRMSENNPMSNPQTRKKMQSSLKDLFEKHPEKRLNNRMAKFRKSGKKNSIEQKMADVLDKMKVDYIFQYPILKYNVDFCEPNLKIVIECDGIYWHKGNEEKDAIRQKRIENEGWTVIRFTDKQINNEMELVEDELCRVFGNHTGEYNTIAFTPIKIEHWQVKRPKLLFNLSVEDDESYIAKGFVVHNCRCMALPTMPLKGKADTKTITKTTGTKTSIQKRIAQDPVARGFKKQADAEDYLKYKDEWKTQFAGLTDDELKAWNTYGNDHRSDIPYDIQIKLDTLKRQLPPNVRQALRDWQGNTHRHHPMSMKRQAYLLENGTSKVAIPKRWDSWDLSKYKKFLQSNEAVTSQEYLQARAFSQAYTERILALTGETDFTLYRGFGGNFGEKVVANLKSEGMKRTRYSVNESALSGYTSDLMMAKKHGIGARGFTLTVDGIQSSEIFFHRDLLGFVENRFAQEYEFILLGKIRDALMKDIIYK